jgi:SAM-dependent methyltransferase
MTISARQHNPVDVTNLEQATAWDGAAGDEWTVHADRHDAACRHYDPHLIDAARIAATDHVLDIGCGTGMSTRKAARAAIAGTATGIDLSARMLDEARRRSDTAGLANTTFIHGDAQVHTFPPAAADVLISRLGTMFFGDPVAAFSNLAHALRSGGRVALLTWQELANNDWVLALRDTLAAGRSLPEPPANAPGPFGLADPSHIRSVLTTAGFDDIELTDVREPMYAGADTEDALKFVTGLSHSRALLGGLDEHSRHCALETLRNRLAAHTTPNGVLLGASCWLITAHRS